MHAAERIPIGLVAGSDPAPQVPPRRYSWKEEQRPAREDSMQPRACASRSWQPVEPVQVHRVAIAQGDTAARGHVHWDAKAVVRAPVVT